MGEVYDEFVQELSVYRTRYAGDPDAEMVQLWLLALEREQIVAVGYREDLIQKRLDQTKLPKPVRDLMRQALVWAWKDEEMHAIYIRGALLRHGGLVLRGLAFAQQWAGAVGGWVSSVRQNVRWREAPLSRAVATLLAVVGLFTGKVSRAVRKQLRFHPFREFCAFNVDAERTAALAWGRLAEIAEASPQHAEAAVAYRRMEEDERRHARIFEVFARALTPDDQLAPGETAESLAAAIGEIGEVFLPRALRRASIEDNPLGSGGRVVALRGDAAADKRAIFRRALDEAGLDAILAGRAAAVGKDVAALSVAVKPSFMLGYNKRDRSSVIDPELLVELTAWLGERGVRDVAVVEAPNLYDHFYGHRSVREVAHYLGIEEGSFRLVDVSEEQEPHAFVRGMGLYTIGRTWQDADVRVSFSKMRSHPIEMAYLTVANVESLGGRCDEYLFSDRQAHRDAALMTVMNAFPPHFALIDGYDLAADGLVGTMGCPRPKTPRRFYAGADAIAVDVTAARHMGVKDPTRFPILRAACYWFGDPTARITVEGDDTPIEGWRGPYSTEISTMLSFLASPVYEFGSGRGALFVAEIDEAAFPPLSPEGFFLRAARASIRALLGLRLPR
jgi:uncharacterized protein (DUF362 family)